MRRELLMLITQDSKSDPTGWEFAQKLKQQAQLSLELSYT